MEAHPPGRGGRGAGDPLRSVRAPEKSGPHHHGRGAGGKLSVGKRTPVRCPGGRQIPLRPGEGGAGVRFRYAYGGDRLGGGTGKLSKGAAAAALQRKRLAGGPHCGSAAGDIERQPGPDQHPAAAGAGKKSGGGRAEYPVSEPPGQQPDAAVRRVRLCAPVSPVQHCHDLSFRQRAADVPLLRTLRAGGGHLPGMRRLDEACWRGYAKGGGGAAGAVPGGGHPADGCRYHRRGP